MFKTKDGIVHVTTGKDISDVMFQPADWSILNVPSDIKSAKRLANGLYNTPSARHVSLLVNRQKRKDRLHGLANLTAFGISWKFLDNISLSYGKPSTCSNNGFLPICEQAFLVCKGDPPNTKNTAWASHDEYQNATNEWVLLPQSQESDLFRETYYQKFTWSLQMIMLSLVGSVEYGRFIYGLPLTPIEAKSLHAFCKKYKLTAELFMTDMDEALKIINIIDGE